MPHCFKKIFLILFVFLSFSQKDCGQSFICSLAAAEADLEFNRATYPQPMVWVKSLNYRFRGVEVEADCWHIEKQARLKDLGTIFKPHNVAEARITVWFSEGDDKFTSVTYSLPYLFVSGWKSEDLDEGRKEQAISKFGFHKVLSIKESHPTFMGGDGDRRYLEMLISFLGNSKVSRPFFKDRFVAQLDDLEALREFTEPGTKKPLFRIENGIFAGRFYDTEQAIYCFLNQPGLEKEFAPIPERSIVGAIVLEIASKLDMCIDCGDMGAAIEALKTGYAQSIIHQLESVKKCDVSGVEIFTLVSSSHSKQTEAIIGGLVSDEVEWNSRDSEKTNFNKPLKYDSIQLEEFLGFIPQMHIRLGAKK